MFYICHVSELLLCANLITITPVVDNHYGDVIMGAMASQIASLTIVYTIIYPGEDQRKHQSSASLAFVRGINRWPVNSPHKWPATRKMFPFDDVMMCWHSCTFIDFFFHFSNGRMSTLLGIREISETLVWLSYTKVIFGPRTSCFIIREYLKLSLYTDIFPYSRWHYIYIHIYIYIGPPRLICFRLWKWRTRLCLRPYHPSGIH